MGDGVMQHMVQQFEIQRRLIMRVGGRHEDRLRNCFTFIGVRCGIPDNPTVASTIRSGKVKVYDRGVVTPQGGTPPPVIGLDV